MSERATTQNPRKRPAGGRDGASGTTEPENAGTAILGRESGLNGETAGPRVWRFVVPVDPSELSLNKRLHWRARARLTKRHREAGFRTWVDAGKPTCAGRVRVSLLVRRVRSLDGAQVRAGWKAAEDGLLVGLDTGIPGGRLIIPSLLGDDGPARVEEGPVTWETGKAWAQCPSVVVTVEELT